MLYIDERRIESEQEVKSKHIGSLDRSEVLLYSRVGRQSVKVVLVAILDPSLQYYQILGLKGLQS